jgi:hypothetical protein
VKAYVETSVQQDRSVSADVFANAQFLAQPDELRERLIRRVVQLISTLNDASHIGYGISGATFAAYAALAVPS